MQGIYNYVPEIIYNLKLCKIYNYVQFKIMYLKKLQFTIM